MFQWNVEKLIDLACMDDLTVADIAKELGISPSWAEKQIHKHRGEIEAARESINVSERLLIKVLDLWFDGATEAKIAVSTDLSLGVVRRLIRISQFEEGASRNADACADSLAALRAAFPNKFYEEDPRATNEFAGRPIFLLAADVVAPFSEERVAA